MVIDQISGNPMGLPSVQKPFGGELNNFNSVLSEKTSTPAGGVLPSCGGAGTSSIGPDQELPEARPVKIGTITSKNPTVSDLLIQNPGLRKECWNIIFASQNRDKAYTRIPDGTDIYYDPASKELLWGDMLEETRNFSTMASVSQGPESGSGGSIQSAEAPEKDEGRMAAKTGAGGLIESLVEAVQPMIGKSYADVNCYELLVNGLSRMGIRYYGRDGLGNQMVAGARDRGLPMNAYLNGEGLIHFSGSETFRKSFVRVSDPVSQARQVLKEMASHLERGSILSFSTESRGHTGIVSNKGGAWTFINSGVMDNPVETVTTAKGVGEESLAKEIENWFRLAARKNESLVITLGKLSQNKLAAYGDGKGHSA